MSKKDNFFNRIAKIFNPTREQPKSNPQNQNSQHRNKEQTSAESNFEFEANKKYLRKPSSNLIDDSTLSLPKSTSSARTIRYYKETISSNNSQIHSYASQVNHQTKEIINDLMKQFQPLFQQKEHKIINKMNNLREQLPLGRKHQNKPKIEAAGNNPTSN